MNPFSEFVIAWCVAIEAEANSQTVSIQWIGGKTKHGGMARRTFSTQWIGGMAKRGGVARRTFSTQWIGVRPCMEVWQGGHSAPNVSGVCSTCCDD